MVKAWQAENGEDYASCGEVGNYCHDLSLCLMWQQWGDFLMNGMEQIA